MTKASISKKEGYDEGYKEGSRGPQQQPLMIIGTAKKMATAWTQRREICRPAGYQR